MPLTPNFTTSQPPGQPSVITVTDASTGSDAAITARRVYLVDYEGNYVVESSNTTTNYTPWPLVDASIDIDCLTEDMALSVVVTWNDVNGVQLYSDTQLTGFTSFNETFYYSLTQGQAAVGNPSYILQDNTYFDNKCKLRSNIDSGNQAISLGGDITTAQFCYNLATVMVNNQNLYF